MTRVAVPVINDRHNHHRDPGAGHHLLGDRPVKQSVERAATTVEDEKHVSGRTLGFEQDHLGSESLECGHCFDLVGPITLRPLPLEGGEARPHRPTGLAFPCWST